MNDVLVKVRQILFDLEKALECNTILDPDQAQTLQVLRLVQVPWKTKFGPAIKNLDTWLESISRAFEQLSMWLDGGTPKVVWLAGLFNPKGFLSAIVQLTGRHNRQWVFDEIRLFTTVTKLNAKDIKDPPSDGFYVTGFFLDGCQWDWKRSKLVTVSEDAFRVELPVFHIIARSSVAQNNIGYKCPVFMYSSRLPHDLLFHINVATDQPAGYWTRRGVAICCQYVED